MPRKKMHMELVLEVKLILTFKWYRQKSEILNQKYKVFGHEENIHLSE